MAYVYGNKISKSGGNPWRTFISYSVSSTDTTTTLTVSMGMNPTDGWIKSGKRVYSLSGTGQTSKSKTESDVKVGSDTHTAKISATWSWPRGTSAATKTITAKTVYTGSKQDGTSTATLTVTVPALTSHTVTYAANGGSSTPTTQRKYYGINIALAGAISRTGYKFAGWKGSGATTSTYSAGATYSVNSTTATTMTAQWTANTFYVRFNANGGTGTMSNETFSYGTAKALTSNAFTKTGYTFYGWATSATGSRVYTNGQSVSNLTTSDGGVVDLYALWTPNTYTVHYNGNGATGGSTADSTHTYDTAKALTQNGFTRTNYDFKGWSTSETGGVVYTDEQSVTNLTEADGATVNLYAVWELGYGVPTFKENTISVYRANSSGALADEGAYGYIHFEWNDGQYPVGTSLNTTPSARYKLSTDTTWTNITGASISTTNNTYTVTFGGSLDITKQYDVQLLLTDTIGGVAYTQYWDEFISISAFTIDVNKEGTAVSFFESAPDDKEGLFAPPMNSTELNDFIDSLNRDFRGSVDWIVEEGTSGLWKYTKWNSGFVDLRKKSDTQTPASWTTLYSAAALYYQNFSTTLPFAVYDGIADINLEAVGTNIGWVCNNKMSNETTIAFTIVRYQNQGGITYSAHVIGRWK